jgi:5-methyltetrahydropteroyltriglutamate--homocysteine methyltransferase
MTTIKEELHVSARTTPPFRADHVGSLLRPPELRTAREDHASGRIDADELRAVEDRAIADAVKMQEEIGLLTVTDGEFRRASWHMDFIYQLGGIHPSEERMLARFRNDEGTIEFTPPHAQVDGRVRLEHTIFGDDFATLKGLATTAVPKQTIPSPSMVHYRGGRAVVDEDVYPDMEAFWADVAAAYAEEIRRLGELGCTYLQLDDTCFAYLNDPEQRRQLQARGDDAEHLHLEYIRHFNDAVRDRPEGMTIATHTCRGNFRSSWVAEGGYDFVAEPFFNELDTDAFFMEWDDERSGTFDALRFVPKGKFVVLGLVTSKRPAMETKDELKRRVEEAARFVPLDQLCLSPQCGFSSTVDGNALTFEQQREKLRLVVETAAEIWG